MGKSRWPGCTKSAERLFKRLQILVFVKTFRFRLSEVGERVVLPPGAWGVGYSLPGIAGHQDRDVTDLQHIKQF